MSFLTIYKASAGSGKTFTLAAKYTAYLLSGEKMQHAHLLAVTFTNKATGEMKERILNNLYGIAYGTNDEDNFLKLVRKHLTGPVARMSVAQLRQHARQRLSDLIHDFDHFAVQTIDAFFQSLLGNLAHELGLSANFRIQIDDKEVVDRAVDNIMARISPDHLTDPKDIMLRKWVTDFIERRITDGQSWDIRAEFKNFAKQLKTDAYVAHDVQMTKILQDMDGLRQFENRLKEKETEVIELLKTAAADTHNEILRLGGSTDEKTAYKNYLDVKRTHSIIYNYVIALMNGNLDREPSPKAVEYLELRTPGGLTIQALEDKRIALQQMRNACILARKNINELRLLADIAREIDAINTEENHFMLGNTPVFLDRLIGDSDAPFVMERAGNRFEHIMIDEFQDTSPLQWKNFDRLLINNTAQGQECLIVGDVKQGIYRFRGGDWKKLTELSEKNPDTTLPLDTNFRSARNIIEFNNKLFTLMPHTMGLPWPNDAEQKINNKEGGYVRVSYNKEEEELYEDVASQVRMLMDKQKIDLKKFAILVRRNKDADDLISYFRKNHPDLRLISSEAFFLRSSRAVQQLMAALRYLRDTKQNDKNRDHISQTYLEQDTPLPEDFVAKANELRRRPLYELCETLIDIFRLTENANETPFLFYFLDEVLEYLEEKPSNLTEFIDYWDEILSGKSIPGGESDAIRIVTIHKSKGLAFHTVLMPFFNWKVEDYRRDDILWCPAKESPLDHLPILPINPFASKQMRESLFAPEFNEDCQAQHIENLNLVYVAFTRTIQNLLVWGLSELAAPKEDEEDEDGEDSKESEEIKKTTVADELYDALQNILEPEPDGEGVTFTYGSPESVAEKKKNKTAKEPSPFDYDTTDEVVRFIPQQKEFCFRQSSKAREFFAPLTDTEEAYRHDGTLLHDILSRITTCNDIEAALQWAWREGLATTEWVNKHRQFITSRIMSPKVKGWFSPNWQVLNEQAIICPHPERPMLTTRRPDRVITNDTETIVIDFKFARHDSRHFDQVKHYCDLLREMGYKEVKGFLWYVYNNEIYPV